jgi:uncharacterized protein (TIGR02757 family)
MTQLELKEFLDEKVDQYNRLDFIESDPISIPHQFSQKEDIEIIGFLVATIAWGKRVSIIKNGNQMINLLGNSPFDFVMNHSESDLNRLNDFKHRTFNGEDFKYFIRSLKNIYKNHSGLEAVFNVPNEAKTMLDGIENFRNVFFEIAKEENKRTFKHVSSPLKGSAAKRINMYLRWMVRQDRRGVDFGIWNSISPSVLSCPLDVHSGNVARQLGILNRKQNDWKALTELDLVLRRIDEIDPVKYDFALFGLGVFEGFK